MPTGEPNDLWMGPELPLPLQSFAIPISVAVYDPTKDAGARFEALDNFECTEVEKRIGPDPGRATFRYNFAVDDDEAPKSMEQALGTGFGGQKVVAVDDRLVVKAVRPDGQAFFLFDGKPQAFSADFGPRNEDVTIDALGIAKLLWDDPLPGAVMRDGGTPSTVADHPTDVIAQWNPRGRGNCSPDGANANVVAGGSEDYPTFLDEFIVRDPAVTTDWTLPKCARYLMFSTLDKNTLDGVQAVQLPTGSELDRVLVSRQPKPGIAYNPADTSTYKTAPINASDRIITGRGWPDVLDEEVKDKGFGTWLSLDTADDGVTPETTMNVALLQAGPLKSVYLQAIGSYLDVNLSNTNEGRFSRDLSEAANRWLVIGGLRQYETSWVLYPAFPCNAADAASSATIAAFDESSAGFDATNYNAYRTFVVDETGEGHYAPGSATKLTTVPDLSSIFPTDMGGHKQYVDRRRRPIGTLVSQDSTGKPYKWKLQISTDSVQTPGLWDGTGTWQTVEGGVELLDDRLGVRITQDNPNKWNIGRCTIAGMPFRSGIVKVVKCMAAPDTDQNKAFRLRLTCVIEGDNALIQVSNPSANAALPAPVTRTIDARDRYFVQYIAPNSEYNHSTMMQTVRDDGDKAFAEADQARIASEAGTLGGDIVLPYFTMKYELGDRIQGINGRNLGLRTDNPSTSNANAAVYPVVVGIRWQFTGRGQFTILTLSDRNAYRRLAERHNLPKGI